MSVNARRDHDLEWFRYHGKPVSNVKTSWQVAIVQGKFFYLTDRVKGGTYKMIFGYHKGAKLQARMWYFSGSPSPASK